MRSRLKAGLRLGGRSDLERLVVFVPPLVLDICFNRSLLHCAHRRTEVSAGPPMLAPVLFLQLRKLCLQMPSRTPFDVLRKFCR